ncbi:MAG: hypothetical protein GY942_03715, partial [Aestuariibacter sp.]|nr:hypothetical protein [Aestuariibacter sp.]
YIYTRTNALSDLSVIGNTIQDNVGYGIYVYSENTRWTRSQYVLENNTIARSGTGIYCYGYNSELGVEILGNDVSGGSEGIYCNLVSYYNDASVFEALISDNDVYGNSGRGIYCYVNRTYVRMHPEITGNRIYQNGGDGIRCARYGSYNPLIEPVITLNEVYENGGLGINCVATTAVDALYNDVRDNASTGVYLAGGNGSNVSYNNLDSNGGTYELSNGSSNKINARYNYWGTALTAEMDAGGNPKNITRIYDVYDDAGKGTVDYSQWLGAAVVLPTAPYSQITSPSDGSTLKTSVLRVQGVAVSPVGVARVEVSPDSGLNWYEASGQESWSYDWTVPADGTYTFTSRVIDNADQVEAPGAGVSITIDSSLPTTSGALTADETWSGSVTLTGDVTVPSGVTLTIDPGAVVSFSALSDDQGGGSDSARTELVVEGALSAVGTVSDPIVFTSTSANPAKGDWYGIRAVSSEGITLSHCTVEYSRLGVDARWTGFGLSSVTITDCTIQETSGNGIYISGAGESKVSVNISGNSVLNNSGRGIYCDMTDTSTELTGSVDGNTVSNNGGYGVYIYTRTNALSDLSVIGNTIQDNVGYGIYVYSENTRWTRSQYVLENN